MELRMMPITALVPAPYNPRRPLGPKDPAYRKLRASLEAFGLVEPLVWNESTGHVVGGHARLRIANELGYEEVPVSVVRLDPAREKALNIVLNNQEAQGRYDPARLADLLTELKDLPELELSGFDESTLTALRFEPVADLAEEEASDRIEVILVCDPERYSQAQSRIEDLVRDFSLEVHVRHGVTSGSAPSPARRGGTGSRSGRRRGPSPPAE